MDKLHSYQGFSGRFSEWRDNLKARFANWREDHEGESLVDISKSLTQKTASNQGTPGDKDDYSHIYRSVSIPNFIIGLNSVDFLSSLDYRKSINFPFQDAY